MLVSVINLIAMSFAIKGSNSFVKGDFENGSWYFMVGNVINMTIGLALGNIWLFIAQSCLMFYTLNMVSINTKLRYSLLALLAIILILILGISNKFTFNVSSIIDVIATIGAVYGAYSMSKQNWLRMAQMWIIADIGFLYVAYDLGLIGLAIQSALFIYHGYLRLTNKPIPLVAI